MCQQGYVVQDSGFNPMLTCSDTKGDFSGLNGDGKLPQCTEWDSENSFINYKLEEYYYFDGECWAAKERIKINFIAALQASLGNVCSATNCSVSSVEAYCFNETVHTRERRSERSTMSVSVVLTVATEGKNKISPAEAIMMQERIYQTRAESNVSLDMGGGMTLKLTSIQVSNPSITCPLGSYADRFTLSCVICSKGTYHDVGDNECRSCPRGQYQPISGQIECLECPAGTSTPEVASIDANQCVETCQPGYVSETGTIPCSPCDMGSYSAGYGQTQCSSCTGSKTTRANIAATSTDECYDFDLEFSSDKYSYGNASVVFTPTSNITSLYLSLWMKCSNCDRIMVITDANEKPVLSLGTSKGFINVTLCGFNLSFPVYGILDNPRWHHISLQVKDNNIIIFVDGGTEIKSSQACAYETVLTSGDYKLLIGGDTYVGSVTSLNLWDVSFNDSEILTLPRCVNDQRGNMIAWRQFQKLRPNAMILTTVQALLARMKAHA
ncbi:uncharacterized protein LOC127836821 isoform X2 [Dreissena polymorpha]|uniref:Tyrosine-protein kinase ephrin type A/B receptor-like domain-containing protein n=1 Tax=Dreissena polymorpha TaxID=45954 RepID=A0A9D4F3U0_DREPO|nr:uncharacterized protein LOC127836821 isoform X2 [Dreissena polymorpha]KAH3791318.1 hypothetical protein DPMN_144801 [Dreissena polymorpha]